MDTQWGAVPEEADPSIEINGLWFGGFQEFDFSMHETYIAPKTRDHTSFSSDVWVSRGDLLSLTQKLDVPTGNFFLSPRELHVDRPRSYFPWTDQARLTKQHVIGTFFLIKGVGRGGGIQVYDGAMMFRIGSLDGGSESAAKAQIWWGFVPKTAIYIPTDVEDGWCSTILMDVIAV